jgi:hypothetical protein
MVELAKLPDFASLRISLSIARFIPLFNSYYRTFESPLPVTKVRQAKETGAKGVDNGRTALACNEATLANRNIV